MFMFYLKFLILFLLTSAYSSTIIGETFIKEKGELVSTLEYTRYKTSHFWNSDGNDREAFNKFTFQGISLFVKYGVTEFDTLVARGAHAFIHESMNGNTIGFEDIELAWRRALFLGCGYELAAQCLVIVPAGNEKDSLRYGRFGTELDLHGTKYFWWNKNPAWVEALVGYRVYDGFPSDQVIAKTRVGFDYTPWFQLSFAGVLNYGILNGTKHVSGPTILWEPNFRLFKIEIETLFRLTCWAYAKIGGFKHVWGRNVGTGEGYYASLLFDF